MTAVQLEDPSPCTVVFYVRAVTERFWLCLLRSKPSSPAGTSSVRREENSPNAFTLRSQDRGQSWQDPFPLDLEFGQPLRNVYVGSGPLVLPDGETLIPIEATNQAGSQIVVVTRSRSSARAVSPPGMCLEDHHGRLSYGDPRWTRLSDGTIVLLAWTFDNITEETVLVSRSISTDNSQSWSAPSKTGLPSQVTTPLTLHFKTILAAGNVRFSPAGIWVWSSRDAGITWNLTSPVQLWDEKTEQIVGVPGVPKSVCDRDADGIWNSLRSSTFGTPDLLTLDDKRVLMTYYATKRSVRTSGPALLNSSEPRSRTH